MIRHFCDMCGNELNSHNTRMLCISNTLDPYSADDNDVRADRVYEICTRCANTVLDVIHDSNKLFDVKPEESVGAVRTKQEKRSNENSFNEWFFKTTQFLEIPAGCEIRIHNIIKRNKKDNLGLFAKCTDEEIKQWRNCGPKTSKQIMAMRDMAKRSIGNILDRMDERSENEENSDTPIDHNCTTCACCIEDKTGYECSLDINPTLNYAAAIHSSCSHYIRREENDKDN